MRLTESSKWKEYLKQCRTLYDRGATIEHILAHLRKRGASKVESIRVLIEIAGVTNEKAKMIVHFSAVWRDVRDADDKLHVTVEQTVDELLKSLEEKRRRPG
jgi:hypothetical protein